MFFRDFTGYYTLPATANAHGMMVLGDFQTLPINPSFSGPRSEPPRLTLPHAEILPANLIGPAIPSLSESSTFRVVRSCAEVECIGFFDCINCFDNAFVSTGPCHWTLGIAATGTGTNRAVSEGELPGYLSYLRHIDLPAFQALFQFFGANVEENWVRAGIANGGNLFSRSQRKYSGRMQLQLENGQFQSLPMRESEWDYFKSWHWHYRFVSAGRTVNPVRQGYQRRMWDMARMRIRDIRSVPWGVGVADFHLGQGDQRPATIGDIITSEKGMALVLRWHIRAPSNMTSNGPGQLLRNVLTLATQNQPTLTWTGDPSLWTDAHEAALIQAILAEATNPPNVGGLVNTLTAIDTWPSWAPPGNNPRNFQLPNPGTLAITRNSLDFDTANLPLRPNASSAFPTADIGIGNET